MADPLFSVVIATYRRPALLHECLSHLAALDYPRRQFEVVVVDDDGADDGGANDGGLNDGGLSEQNVVAPWGERMQVRLLRPGHVGQALARNAGAAQARGQWLAFIDDDCVVPADLLRSAQARVEQHPGAVIAGRMRDARPDNLWSAASQAQLDAVAAYYNRDAQHAGFAATANLIAPADGFRKLGGFARLPHSEDREFLDRWTRAGRPAVYAPELAVAHAHPSTWPAFRRRNAGYGQGAWAFAQARRSAGVGAPRVDLSFYVHLMLYPFKTRIPRRWRVAGAIVLARLAYLRGYLGAKWAPHH